MNDLDFLTQEQEESVGSIFRTIGKMIFTMGWKVYAQGKSNEESFFPYARTAEKKAAQAKAAAFQAEAGASNAPDKCYAFIVPKDTVIAGGDNWNVDQYFLRAVWQEQLLDGGTPDEIDDRIVFNSVKAHVDEKRIKIGSPFYGALRFVPSPFHYRQGEAGKTRDVRLADGTTEKRWPTIAVLDVVYATEEEAKGAAAQFVTESDPNVPPGWEKSVWEMAHSDIKTKFAQLKAGGMPEAAAIATISKGSYDIDDEKYVMAVLGIEFLV